MQNIMDEMFELPYSLGTDVNKNVVVRYLQGEDSFSFVEAQKVVMSATMVKYLDDNGINKQQYVKERIDSALKIIDLWRVAFDHHMAWDRDANNRRFVHKYYHCWGTPLQCFWTLAAIKVRIFKDKTIFSNHIFYVEHMLDTGMVYINIADQALLMPPTSNVHVKSIWQQVMHYDDLNAEELIRKYESFLATPVKRVNDPVHPLDMYPDEKEYRPMEKYLHMLEHSLWRFNGDVQVIYDFDRAEDEIIRITINVDGKIIYNNEFDFQNVNKDTMRHICEDLNIKLWD